MRSQKANWTLEIGTKLKMRTKQTGMRERASDRRADTERLNKSPEE